MKKIISDAKVPVKIWTQDVEEEAVKQLLNTANLPFVFKHVAAMPDVHAGSIFIPCPGYTDTTYYPPKQEGWECPKCNSIYASWYPKCDKCSIKDNK